MIINNSSARAKNYYTYNASGTKLKIKHIYNPKLQSTPILGSTASDAGLTTTMTTDYVGNKIYENGTLSKILVDNGYIENGKYFFYIKDHLGNNRIVADASGTVIQSNQYYPFGMLFTESTGQDKQDFKYNGKELDPMHGLNLYYYSARYLDNAYGRFTTVDTMAEKYYSWSPYDPIGKTELQSNVKSDYSKGVTINSLSDLTTKDSTGSRSGSVSAEGRAADEIIQVKTSYDQDIKIQGYASKIANSGKAYNASSFNCSTFSESALKTVFPKLDASQYVKVPFMLKAIYSNTNVVAPNNLYNATMKLANATNIKGPKSVIAKPYLEYYGK